MEPDELLVMIRRPALPAGAGGAYRKLAQPASGYALVGRRRRRRDRSGGTRSRMRGSRVTGVGEHAYRATAVETALIGSDGSAGAIAAAAEKVPPMAEVN